MKNGKMLLPFLLSISAVFILMFPASAAGASVTVSWPDDRSGSHLAVDSPSAALAMALNVPQGNVTPMVAAGYEHTVGLKADGTVVAAGDNNDGQCNVGGWTDITQVAAGYEHTVGLKTDGTVVAAGDNDDGQCNVGRWTHIIQVAARGRHTVGLKSDGTVVAVGDDSLGQCNVGRWRDIVQVSAGACHTVGIRQNGTVVAVGREAEVAKWSLWVATTEYTLAISSTAGGSATTPGEGTLTYDAGAVVDLVATPDEGYLFVEWAGDVDTIGNVNSAATNIAINGDYSITANFEEIPTPTPANWPLVGGIMAVAAAVGLGVFFVRGKRALRTKETRS